MSAQNPGDHHFFARKFEAIVNQEIIRLLDAYLYGHLPDYSPGLTSYWESLYHMDDDLSKPGSARYSAYQSFMRQGLKLLYSDQSEKEAGKCDIPKQALVKEVTVFRQKDEFRGLIVTLKDALSGQLSLAEFEVLFTPVLYTQRSNN